MKALSVIAVLLLFGISAGPSTACSMVACVNSGRELRSDFVVAITHDDRPLAGVTVQITRDTGGNGDKLFSGKTAPDGTVHVSKLSAGDYWLRAELLGVPATYQCFHVNAHPSRKAKRRISFGWGDEPFGVSQIAGKLMNSQWGQGGTPTWNLTHRVSVPISEAKLTLRAPVADAVYSTVSDGDGRFTFNGIPDGLYVLHIEGGVTPGGTIFAPANLLVRLSGSAKPKMIAVTEYDSGGGSCGGWSLEPDHS